MRLDLSTKLRDEYTHVSSDAKKSTGVQRARWAVGGEGNRGLKIFLEFWLLIGLLAAFNFYNYFRRDATLFLVVGIICVVVFIGWALFYVLYARKNER